ncbi:RNA 2'-phosphotransferase [Pokkaliibacter plantistimulans]|uniref:Probable RNA 2'-phosphotransferase n=1 Tax=Pokkaliibacter plantistimulans TaxID=1635171 RepID=A0ABX5M157_9GAMM|nr:RNA 2'-phosphotransferase [Pokkaliibacter plantistimulans]PXF31463.1 RNA 2'-phosphotransferase [Pokkaliibacter plantistimulans]
MDKQITAISKYFSYVLRHQPDAIGLRLDEQGWAVIDELIAKTKEYPLTAEIVRLVVETNDKQRFGLSADGMRIRANQGHSIEVDLALPVLTPPAVLYHGTAERFLPSILATGLHKQQRHHVHLTESVIVAKAVGGRYGKPVVLQVNSAAMDAAGIPFYCSANKVWLVEQVATEYLHLDATPAPPL